MDRRADETKQQTHLPILVPALAVAGLVALLAILAWFVSARSAPGAP
jgi:fatty acid desaturase